MAPEYPVRGSYTCTTDRIGPARWIAVRIHPDREHLRRAAHRLAPHREGPSYWDNCAGCFHGMGNTSSRNGYAGLLRLAETDLTAEIVAHELVHAAAAVLRSYGYDDLRLGRGVRQREEQLAYIYGELFASLQPQLLAHQEE